MSGYLEDGVLWCTLEDAPSSFTSDRGSAPSPGPVTVEVWGERRSSEDILLYGPPPDFDALAAAAEMIEQRDRQIEELRGKPHKKGEKVEQAIALKVRNPELSDLAIANRVGCSPSTLSRSTEYQRYARAAEKAVARERSANSRFL
jgi:hypothetical protein